MEEKRRFVTEPQTCPYLPDREWRLEVLHVCSVRPEEHEQALNSGVRRFGETYFHPVCENCQECVPLRVPVSDFVPSKSQRRVLRANPDISLEIGEPMMDGERLDLHHRFHLEKHLKQDWPEPQTNPVDYLTNFVLNSVPTHEFRYRLDGRLVAIAYVDESPGALSSQYAFYDPELAARSLGTFDVLKEIETAKRWKKRFLHLGYYVRGCRSMVYKASFRPHEILVSGEWQKASLEF